MNLRGFGDWALAQKSVANPPPNYKFKGECVSLIQQYLYLVFGNSFRAYGNAKDWAKNIPVGFKKVSGTPQRGDIIVYGANYPGSNGFGHIAFIDVNNKFFEQNGAKKGEASYRDTIPNGYVAILRPENQKALGLDEKKRTHIHLPASVNSWRIYPLDKKPIVGNECGKLKPSKFGGLDYDVIRWVSETVAIINTRDWGQVQIYVGPDTSAIIS